MKARLDLERGEAFFLLQYGVPDRSSQMKIRVLSSKNRCTLAWSENANGIAEGRFSVSERGYIQDMGHGKLRFKNT